MDVVETRRGRPGGTAGGSWVVRSGEKSIMETTSLREKDICHLRLGRVNFLFEEFQQTINENGKLTSSFLLQLLGQLLFIISTDLVCICSNVIFPLWKKSASLEYLLNIQIIGLGERAI